MYGGFLWKILQSVKQVRPLRSTVILFVILTPMNVANHP